MEKRLLILFILWPLTFFGQCWQQAAAGYTHTIALKTDGTLWAWGQNDKGQLGTGNTVNQSAPVQIGTENSWVWVGAGSKFSIALKADGSLWTWGTNECGQLGNGTVNGTTLPAQVGLAHDWSSASVEGYHVLAVKTNGTLWAWGLNLNNQLGDDTAINKTAPVQIGTDTNWLKAATGTFHSAALKTDNTLWTWGNNAFGQLATGYSVYQFSFPVKISLDTNWSRIALGGETTFALKTDSSLWGCGYQMGAGLIFIQPEDSVSVIEPSYNNNYFIKTDGTLWASGDNTYGQLGNGNQIAGYEYAMVNNDTNWVAISSTLNTTAAIKDDGTLWMWGDNEFGQLANTTNSPYSLTPLQVLCPAAGLEAETLPSVLIYPNPANEVLNIQHERFDIEKIIIYDSTGKIVLTQNKGSQINVSQLPAGFYFITLYTSAGSATQKFVRQ